LKLSLRPRRRQRRKLLNSPRQKLKPRRRLPSKRSWSLKPSKNLRSSKSKKSFSRKKPKIFSKGRKTPLNPPSISSKFQPKPSLKLKRKKKSTNLTQK
jgi:hypothetical protein